MAGSAIGKNFVVTTWGESHGKALGVVIDGCPAGIALCEEDIQIDMDRRKPGSNAYGTKRCEEDLIQILSGVFEGKTTGTPLSILVFNKDHHSCDYTQIASCYRPGHADFTFFKKYGFRDYRGGGRSSGRETLARVAAGAVAKKMLAQLGISITSYTYAIGDITIHPDRFSLQERELNPLFMPDKEAALQAEAYLKECISQNDSAGGIIETRIEGMPVGIGEPVFDKLDACIGKAIFSIGAVKGVEFGSGFQAASAKGSINNDAFRIQKGEVVKKTNHAGGVLGGMSDADTILFRAAFKPTPSIFRQQDTVDTKGNEVQIQIKGRHDPIIVPRAVVVVEAMTAITIADLLISNMSAQMNFIEHFYKTRKTI